MSGLRCLYPHPAVFILICHPSHPSRTFRSLSSFFVVRLEPFYSLRVHMLCAGARIFVYGLALAGISLALAHYLRLSHDRIVPKKN